MARAAEGPETRWLEDAGDALVLEVPGDAAHLSTARLFAAAVGRHFGVDESAIDDVKLGVSEAVTTAVDDPERVGAATVVAWPDGALLWFAVRWVRRGDRDLEASMSLQVVRGLFETADMAIGPDRAARIEFAVTMAPVRADTWDQG